MKSIDPPVVYVKITPLLLLLLTIFLGTAQSWAKAPETGQKSSVLEVTKDTLQVKIEAINTRQGLDEALKSKLLSVYQSAQDNLSNSVGYKTRADEFNKLSISLSMESIFSLSSDNGIIADIIDYT